MDPRMMSQDMGVRRAPGMERAAPPAPPINPAPRVSPQMPRVDAELNRDVFLPTWADGGASVTGGGGGQEYVRRKNYIPEEQRDLNSIPTSEERIVSMLNQLRHYESLPGVGHWSSGNASVRQLDTDPAYGPPESAATFLRYHPEGY